MQKNAMVFVFYFSFQYSIQTGNTYTIMFNDLDDNIIRDIKLAMALKVGRLLLGLPTCLYG